MKNTLKQLSYFWLLLFLIISCQSKESKQIIDINASKSITENSYSGKWFLVNKKNDIYYYCIDSDRFLEISKNKILDHTPMEDSNFNIDHFKTKGNSTYFYINKNESSYYNLKWIDKNKGILSYQLNSYEPSLFINEKQLKTIENRMCKPKTKSCDFTDHSNKFKFTLEAAEYSNEKLQKNPISAWIIIINKTNSKSQEIHYEPNSWATYSDLPCNSFTIKDFNFDGLEDFAIVWDEGGNGGKLYEYYFQNENGNFYTLDSFPLQHGLLAEDFDFKNKTITTESPVGCCNINVNTYKLNSDKTWEKTNRQEKFNNN